MGFEVSIQRRTFLAAAAAAAGTGVSTGTRAAPAPPADTFKAFADRAKQERWDYREIDASHSPHVTAPDALAALLGSIMARKSA